jgi:protein tyrosine/serine phosphatase
MHVPMTTTGPRRTRRIAVLCAKIIGIAVLSAGAWAGYLRLSGTMHEVAPGLVYRSAQPTPDRLRALIAEKHLRAVINLRGHSDAPWYVAETAVTTAAGVQHIDLSMSAGTEPDAARLDSLRLLLRTTPTPFLLHCEGGADRSGLASALYVLDEMHGTPSDADHQLSFRYGHFPWIGKTGAMDRTFWRVAGTAP